MEEDKKSSVKPVATIKTAAVRPEAQKVVPEVVTKKEEPKKAAVAETAKTVISGKVADVKSAMEKKQEVAEKTVAAEFTFFLAIPVMFGASLLKVVKYGFAFSGMEAAILLTPLS